MMYFAYIILVFSIALAATNSQNPTEKKTRSFTIDYENNRFLKDNEPFRFIAGSFHYFRALPETWQSKLRTMRAAGLNAVTTYVEWSLHNPRDGIYKWDGIADIERFIQLAVEEDLYVILRPGPYICAERDNGGIPFWLFTKYPEIKMRTNDPNYLNEVTIWYNELMPRMQKYLYGRGGPIILVQVENEYGAFACDVEFRASMRDVTKKYVNDNVDAVLFTNDIPTDVKCGKIPNVFATLDFGKGDRKFVDKQWQLLREVEPTGPLVNAEFYPGWFTHWQGPNSIVKTESFIDTFRHMLDDGASVNFYMWFGGTNFGFTAGANWAGAGNYEADITSYDYNAPMTEAGDPTDKYKLIRDVIKNYLPLPNISMPEISPKMILNAIKLTPKLSLLSSTARDVLGRESIKSERPITFEKIEQFSGFVLYETALPELRFDPSVLKIPQLHDRAIVFIDNNLIGVLSRQNLADTLPISLGYGKVLQILVENQGRINFKIADDFKGIIGDVILNQNVKLNDWTITGFPLENIDRLSEFFEQNNNFDSDDLRDVQTVDILRTGPIVYHGTFDIEQSPIVDTYVDTSDWGKGVLYVNGFNLGRYWPLAGPQMTLYLPKELLHAKNNSIVLIELQKAPKNYEIRFSDKNIFTPNVDV